MTIRSIAVLSLLSLAILYAVHALDPAQARPEAEEPTATEPMEVVGKPTPPGMVPVYANKNQFEMGLDEKVIEYLVEQYAGKDGRRIREARQVFGPEAPAHDVTVRPFFGDRYEVTAAQYHAYILAKHTTSVTTTKALDTLNKVVDREIGLPKGGKLTQWRVLYALNWGKLNPAKEGVEPEEKKRGDDLPRPEGGRPLPTWADKVLPAGVKLKVFRRAVPESWGAFGGPAPWQRNYPITFVSLVEAREFADWAGKHVLLEEEWELAARGEDGNMRTWKSPFKAYKKSKTDLFGVKSQREEVRIRWADTPRSLLQFDPKTFEPTNAPRHYHKNEVPVGWMKGGHSTYGLHDMLGNVAEWTDSPFGLYPGAGKSLNPFLSRRSRKTWSVRGGSYGDQPFSLRTTVRLGGGGEFSTLDENRTDAIGFRCGKWPRAGADRAYMTWREFERDLFIPNIGTARKPVWMQFDAFGGLGVERTDYGTDEHHVYVKSETKSVSVLPRRRIAVNGTVKGFRTALDKNERTDPDYREVIGLLQTSIELKFRHLKLVRPAEPEKPDEKEGEEGGDEKGEKEGKPNGKEEGGKEGAAAVAKIVEVDGTLPPGRYVLAYHDRRILVLKPSAVTPIPFGYLNPASEDPKAELLEIGNALDAHAKTNAETGEITIFFPVLGNSSKPKKSFMFRARLRPARKGDITPEWKGTK